jgi:formamidopyrimidine-DNA glycosylase
MPEGPEYVSSARGARKYAVGNYLLRIIVLEKSKYRPSSNKPLKNLTNIVLPALFTIVDTYGKHIIFFLDNGTIIVFHYKMYGRLTHTYDKHCGIVFVLGEKLKSLEEGDLECNSHGIFRKKYMYYSDTMNYGDCHIFINNPEYNLYMSKVGLDYLKGQVTLPLFYQAVKDHGSCNKIVDHKRIKVPRELCDFLLDQEIFSGIGNYLKCDIMYVAQLAPNYPVCYLTDNQIELLYQAVMKVINLASSYGGLTIKTFWGFDDEVGRYERLVYSRDYDPLGHRVVHTEKARKLKDGSIIPSTNFSDDRTTHWVPVVQKTYEQLQQLQQFQLQQQ